MALGTYQEAPGPLPPGLQADEERKGGLLPTGCACRPGTALPQRDSRLVLAVPLGGRGLRTTTRLEPALAAGVRASEGPRALGLPLGVTSRAGRGLPASSRTQGTVSETSCSINSFPSGTPWGRAG